MKKLLKFLAIANLYRRVKMDYMKLDLPSIRGLLSVWESHWSMLKDLGLSTSEADIKLEILKFILVQKVREAEDTYDEHTTDADIRYFEMN
jgi:hypothetical protein